jgi:hypothetical protein
MLSREIPKEKRETGVTEYSAPEPILAENNSTTFKHRQVPDVFSEGKVSQSKQNSAGINSVPSDKEPSAPQSSSRGSKSVPPGAHSDAGNLAQTPPAPSIQNNSIATTASKELPSDAASGPSRVMRYPLPITKNKLSANNKTDQTSEDFYRESMQDQQLSSKKSKKGSDRSQNLDTIYKFITSNGGVVIEENRCKNSVNRCIKALFLHNSIDSVKFNFQNFLYNRSIIQSIKFDSNTVLIILDDK